MKIFVGVCNSQYEVPDSFFWSFINIDCPYKIEVFRSKHPWDVIRNNRIIYNFLASDCDILVKMDIDQAYPSNFFTKFVPLVDRFKVIGPIIHDRWKENYFVPLMFENKEHPLKTMDFSCKTGIVSVPYAHTNLFYAREVWEKIPKPWYEAKMSDDGLNRENHVDFDVLDKIKKAGYEIFIDLHTKVDHRHVEYA